MQPHRRLCPRTGSSSPEGNDPRQNDPSIDQTGRRLVRREANRRARVHRPRRNGRRCRRGTGFRRGRHPRRRHRLSDAPRRTAPHKPRIDLQHVLRRGRIPSCLSAPRRRQHLPLRSDGIPQAWLLGKVQSGIPHPGNQLFPLRVQHGPVRSQLLRSQSDPPADPRPGRRSDRPREHPCQAARLLRAGLQELHPRPAGHAGLPEGAGGGRDRGTGHGRGQDCRRGALPVREGLRRGGGDSGVARRDRRGGHPEGAGQAGRVVEPVQ
uniref:(northern house mosquito) hypothetical protein n=1 Tax=Culex pipiens TaxID=7175 RepID=A0A8D8KY82_CULPI